MKRNWKGFLAGVVACTAAFSLTLSALAAGGIMNIDVDTNMNIKVNGKVFTPTNEQGEAVPVFNYAGTAYAPVRALAKAYGLEVGWDGESNMATVDGETAKDFPGTLYIDGTQTVIKGKEIGGKVYVPIDICESIFGLKIEEDNGDLFINNGSAVLSAPVVDPNGNEILEYVPKDHSDGNYFMWNYLDIAFAADTKKGNIGSKIILMDVDTGSRVKVTTQPGATLPNNFLIMPEKTLKLGGTYLLYVPSGSIKMENGTTFDSDIRIIFRMAETVVHGKVSSGEEIPAGSHIQLTDNAGNSYSGKMYGGNEFAFVNVPEGKYTFYMNGEEHGAINVAKGRVNKVTIHV